jgi:alginate O-acetyltransferase complex protein AlgI
VLFNSYLFLAFLAVATVVYRLVFRFGAQARILWLAAGSLMFYAMNDIGHLPLLAASILFNYAMGVRISAQPHGPARRLWLTLAVSANIALLIGCKILAVQAGAGGFAAFWPWLSHGPALPLGISFFTFTQIAFLIDCSRGEVSSPRLLDYGVFVAWFPHLVAGPLLPHNRILPQLRGPEARRPTGEDYSVGLTLFVVGLFKKVVLADGLLGPTTHALKLLGSGAAHGFASAWIASFACLIIIYFDFSGYSDMAMGASRLFGIDLPVNFYSPLRARNPIDFWRRWHRTLSWFIRGYVYSPFAGRRAGIGQYWRLMAIMAAVGLWHGSTWNFLLWGLYQGVLLCLYNFWRLGLGHRRPRRPGPLEAAAAQAANFTAMVASAGLFYFQDFGQGLRFYGNVFGLSGLGLDHLGFHPPALALFAAELAIVCLAPNAIELVRTHLPRWSAQQLPADRPAWPLTWKPSLLWALALGALAAVALAAIPQTSQFSYSVF